jgi:hypothetical protein
MLKQTFQKMLFLKRDEFGDTQMHVDMTSIFVAKTQKHLFNAMPCLNLVYFWTDASVYGNVHRAETL